METSQRRAEFVGDDLARGEDVALCDTWPELRIAFYNIGINKTEVIGRKWNAKKEKIQRDMQKILYVNKSDMLCLSEFGEIGEGLQKSLPEGGIGNLFAELWQRACNIENEIGGLFRSSAVQPADGVPPNLHMSLLSDSHYVTLIRHEKLIAVHHEYVEKFVPQQPWRGFQKITVRMHRLQ